MSDTTTEATETTEDATQAAEETVEQETGTQGQQDAQEATEDAEPDWRKNFDPDIAAKRIEKLQSEARNLRDRAKKAEEKAKGVDEKDQRISALEAQNLRYEVAFDLGLPKEIALRLQGNTKEEMLADAEELLKLFKAPAAPTRKPIEALRGGGAPEQEPEEKDVRKIGERMFSN